MFDTYQQIFDKRAHSYHKAMRDFPQARKAEFGWVVHYLNLKAGDVLCDVPSGGGYLQGFVSEKQCFFNSIETSLCFASYNVDGPLNKTYVCSFEHLALENQSVDCLVCLAALHHVDNRPQVFAEFRRVVTPQGKILIVDVEEASNTGNFLNIFVNKYNSMGHRGQFIDKQLINMIRNEFSVISCKSHHFRWVFDNEQAMISFCRGLFGLDKATDSDIMQGIKAYLAPKYKTNHVSLEWRLIYILCNQQKERLL
jgi:SAM-dependent methyltransferase